MKNRNGYIAVGVIVLLFAFCVGVMWKFRPVSKTLAFDLSGETLIFVNDAYYRVVQAGEDRWNLPAEITSDMIGPKLNETLSEEREVFVYMPADRAANRMIYLMKESDGTYCYLVFYCNIHYGGASDETTEDLFTLYQVKQTEDIVSITFEDRLITDREKIDVFINALLEAEQVHDREKIVGKALYLTHQNGQVIDMVYDEVEEMVYWADCCYQLPNKGVDLRVNG